jgi:hypothetical protein
MSNHPASRASREQPLPSTMRVRDALAVYFSENGFDAEAYDSATTTGSFFGRKVSVPNPPAHQRGIRLHDLLHLVTGFGTDHTGEGELSAWQARRGFRGMGLYVAAIVAINTGVGLVVAPRRTLAAFKSAGAGPSLFASDVGYESLLDRRLGELRALLGAPERGVATLPRGLHAHAPAATAPPPL